MSDSGTIAVHAGVLTNVGKKTIKAIKAMRLGVHVSVDGTGAVWRYGSIIDGMWLVSQPYSSGEVLMVLTPVPAPGQPVPGELVFDALGQLLSQGDLVAYQSKGTIYEAVYQHMSAGMALVRNELLHQIMVPLELLVRTSPGDQDDGQDDPALPTNLHHELVEILHGATLIDSGPRGTIDANNAHHLARMIVEGLGKNQLSGFSG